HFKILIHHKPKTMGTRLVTVSTFTLLFSTTLLFHPSLSELCNPNDKKVRLQIKKGFKDPYVLTSWKPDTDCCVDWYCVTCDPKTNRTNALFVVKGGLSGQIPPQIGDLPYLENLELHKNENLTGPIPHAITNLKHLKFLSLDWNSLSGSVPDFLSQLKNLTFLQLSFNNLTGPIPGSLSKLPYLWSLRLDRNKLTGTGPGIVW
ncbi:LRR domain containing protein, partial [Trema orientale]